MSGDVLEVKQWTCQHPNTVPLFDNYFYCTVCTAHLAWIDNENLDARGWWNRLLPSEKHVLYEKPEPRYIAKTTKRRFPICQFCKEHETTQHAGTKPSKCLFNPTNFLGMTKRQYVEYVKVLGGYRRFVDASERMGAMICGSCRGPSMFVDDIPEIHGRTALCLRCAIRRGIVCSNCWLTKAEHVGTRCLFSPTVFKVATKRRAKVPLYPAV